MAVKVKVCSVHHIAVVLGDGVGLVGGIHGYEYLFNIVLLVDGVEGSRFLPVLFGGFLPV
jgi:hypothetical protein